VVSTSVRVPVTSQAATSASRSAIRPSADCTAETATSDVSGRTSSASRSNGTSRTVTPADVWARNGNSTLVKSPVAVRTSLPGGSEAATSPTKGDTCAPVATQEGATPTIRA
jgi:hypothetical protein